MQIEKNFFIVQKIIMKSLFHLAHTRLLLAIFVMTACQNSTEELSSSQLLVVERQQIEVRNPPSAPFAKICFTTDYVEMIPYLEF